jgi:predicted phage tail protein
MSAETMHTVYLHGKLGKLYGTEGIEISGRDVKEIFQGLKANFGRGFHNLIKDGYWQITRGKRKVDSEFILERDVVVNDYEVEMPLQENELHVFPALLGAGRFGGIILGVVLIIIGIALQMIPGIGTILGAYTAKIGIGLIIAGIAATISGIINLFMSNPKTGSYSKAEVGQNPSLLYNGPVNVIEQGGPVPVVYGIHMTGSTVISSAIDLYTKGAKGNLLEEEDSTFSAGIGNWEGTGLSTRSGYLRVSGNPATLPVNITPGKNYKLTVTAKAPLYVNFSPPELGTCRIEIGDSTSIYAFEESRSIHPKNITLTFTVPPIVGQPKIKLIRVFGPHSDFDNIKLVLV